MNNKKNGNAFEKQVADIFAKSGFWVHRLQDNRNGQPFDIIACKNNITIAVECKDCKSNFFKLNRIEVNQLTAMQHFIDCGNSNAVFAIGISDKIYVINFLRARVLIDMGIKSISLSDMEYSRIFTALEDFIEGV